MDTQVLFNIAVSLAGFLGGWVLNNIYRSLERLDTDVRRLRRVAWAVGHACHVVLLRWPHHGKDCRQG